MLCSKLSQSSMGPDIKGKNVYGKFLIPSHKLASLRSASKNKAKAKITLIEDERIISKDEEVAETLNDYFVTVTDPLGLIENCETITTQKV